jgi:hypothetical protein
MNDSGLVVFRALFSGGEGIFTPSELLVEAGSTIEGKTISNFADDALWAQPLDVNNRGEVVFWGGFAGGEGVFTQFELVAQTGDAIGGKTLTSIFPLPATINDFGKAVFLASFADGAGIFTQSELLLPIGGTVGGKTLSGFLGSGSGPVINNTDTVAFGGFFQPPSFGEWGLSTESGFLLQRGDTLHGKTVDQVFGPPAVNESGMIAFVVEFRRDPSCYGDLQVVCPTEQAIVLAVPQSDGRSPLERELESELKQLTEALLHLETLDIDAGTAIVSRFISERISEIAKYLCDVVEEMPRVCTARQDGDH